MPQMVEQLPDVMRFFDSLLPVRPEQVIEVPQILLDDVPVRTALRDTQLAEQLVELRRSCPILPCSGLWSSTLTFQFLVVEGETLVFKVLFPDRVQQRLWRRSLPFLLAVEVFNVFAQDRFHLHHFHLQLVFMVFADEPGEGFFALFTKKKVRTSLGTRVRGCTPVSVHPRWRLSSRCACARLHRRSSSTTIPRARPATGTGVLVCPLGSLLRHQGCLGRNSGRGGGPLLLAQACACRCV